MQLARVCLGGDAAVLDEQHRRKLDLPIARAWVMLRDCLRAMGLDLKVDVDASWALLLGGVCWLPGLHFHSEIWAAKMEAEGGEGPLGNAVLHFPLRIERLVDVIGRLVIGGYQCHRRQRGTPLLEKRLLGVSGDLQCGPIGKAEEATGLGTTARSAGSRSIGVHGSWAVRRSCCCRRPQCFGELVVEDHWRGR